MEYKAVVFDLDGTLLDSIEDLANSTNLALEKYGFPSQDVEKYKYFVGDGMYNLVVRAMLQKKANKKLIKECLACVIEEYGKHWADNTKPYQGIPELLIALKEKDLKLAVLSNKPDEFTKIIINKFFPSYFELVFGERESKGIPKKPDPQGAIEIAQTLKVSPQDCLYLGDTSTDMKTAVSAGMYPVGVLWGFREAEEILTNGAKLLIKRPLELMEILN
ncbi:MAG: HAD family hydrolase [Clostridia bacterium]|nr:HAD family hydrolase [Clostridia bacterium]MDD4048369.1 HAD family hydrolase [Clostridia bacterium]